jgi:predicted HicB family RNase H-like nuclease
MKEDDNDRHVRLRLQPEILAKLRQRAASQNIGLNECLAEIAREYLDYLEREESEEAFKLR